MSKSSGFSLLLIALSLFFTGVSFGGQLEREAFPTNSHDEVAYRQWTSRQREEGSLSTSGKGASGFTLLETWPNKVIGYREFSLKSEIAEIQQSSVASEIVKKGLSYFENCSLSSGKSNYALGEIRLTNGSVDSSLHFIPMFFPAQSKEENPLYWTLEKLKETDIAKSLGFLFKLKLEF